MTINTEFDPGQKLWAIHNNKVQEFTIETIEIIVCNSLTQPSFKYTLKIGESAGVRKEIYDFDIKNTYFSSKEELIKSL